jgi:hypothetical protein
MGIAKYHGERGEVEFFASQIAGDASHDWYLEEFPSGGMMIIAERCGSVFLVTGEDNDGDLKFVGRKDKS